MKGNKKAAIQKWLSEVYNQEPLQVALDKFREQVPDCDVSYAYFRAVLVESGYTPNQASTPNQHQANTELPDLIPISINDCHFNSEALKPLKVGNGFDIITNKYEDGVKPATVYVVGGEPGSGKTTFLIHMLKGMLENDPSLKVAAINGEMSRLDFYEETDESPELRDLPMFFLKDYAKYDLASVIEKVLRGNYNSLVIDSFKVIIERIVASTGWSYKQTERWFLDLLIECAEKYNTNIWVIQQVNKDGRAAGTMSLSHDTTGTMFIKIDSQTGERYVIFTKNRRCGRHQFKRMYFFKDENGRIICDADRFRAREKAIKEAQKEKDNRDKQDELFDSLVERLQQSEQNEQKSPNPVGNSN